MFDLARLNKLVGCRVLGSVEPNTGNAPPRSDWPLAARIHQILRAALPGAAFLILFEVATVAIVCAPSWRPCGSSRPHAAANIAPFVLHVFSGFQSGMAASVKRNSFSVTPVAECMNAGRSPAGRIFDMQFRFESIVPTRGRQVT
jgi:hypothetical protein